MNSFARPEEALPYQWPEFPKVDSAVTEYANQEGTVEYQLKSFSGNPSFDKVSPDEKTLVQPAQLQDFKEVLTTPQP
jgi:hypothetical protein